MKRTGIIQAYRNLTDYDKSKYVVVGCMGKAAFESHALATQVSRRRKSNDRPKKRVAYKCPACRKWHVGTPTGKERL